jgi:hypothetical protein
MARSSDEKSQIDGSRSEASHALPPGITRGHHALINHAAQRIRQVIIRIFSESFPESFSGMRVLPRGLNGTEEEGRQRRRKRFFHFKDERIQSHAHCQGRRQCECLDFLLYAPVSHVLLEGRAGDRVRPRCRRELRHHTWHQDDSRVQNFPGFTIAVLSVADIS